MAETRKDYSNLEETDGQWVDQNRASKILNVKIEHMRVLISRDKFKKKRVDNSSGYHVLLPRELLEESVEKEEASELDILEGRFLLEEDRLKADIQKKDLIISDLEEKLDNLREKRENDLDSLRKKLETKIDTDRKEALKTYLALEKWKETQSLRFEATKERIGYATGQAELLEQENKRLREKADKLDKLEALLNKIQ